MAAALALSVVNGRASAEPMGQAGANASLAPVFETVIDAEQAIRMRFQSAPARDIKQFYLQCVRESTEVRLTAGEATICSIGYDVLLRHHFAGDFEALLAWSKRAEHSR
jgi:hypothetical protein